MFGTPGKATIIKKNIRAFSGLPEGDEKAKSRAEDILKRAFATTLNALLDLFDLPRGSGEDGKKEARLGMGPEERREIFNAGLDIPGDTEAIEEADDSMDFYTGTKKHHSKKRRSEKDDDSELGMGYEERRLIFNAGLDVPDDPLAVKEADDSMDFYAGKADEEDLNPLPGGDDYDYGLASESKKKEAGLGDAKLILIESRCATALYEAVSEPRAATTPMLFAADAWRWCNATVKKKSGRLCQAWRFFQCALVARA